eukprot:TRINITY_DN37206_c0_g1_i1.p1 TRINITY_DN37206_c0_g1~~TRINITY_DN37206_c0_g1_i1.p1  ORF type:complete len:142 (+),score=21.82 TRINITY_DN37206_c0_g1_i1:99-524(+)
MSGMKEEVRARTDVLDSAGNTTAAIGKGFAIGSAAFVSLALFSAFVTTAHLEAVDFLSPFVMAGLLIGAMLPYWFTALTMRSVGSAAQTMVAEVRRQLNENQNLLSEHSDDLPDYNRCIAIEIGRAVQQECRDRSRMPSSA